MKQTTQEALYAMGYNFYTSGHYDKAIHYFQYLTMQNPKSARYWLGLGASYQLGKNYEKAAESYMYAAINDQDDPRPPFHASECFYHIDQKKAAREALKSAEILAHKSAKKHQALLGKIALLKRGKKKDGN